MGLGNFDDRFAWECRLLSGTEYPQEFSNVTSLSGPINWPVTYETFQIDRQEDTHVEIVNYVFTSVSTEHLLTIQAKHYKAQGTFIGIQWATDASVPGFDPRSYLCNFVCWLNRFFDVPLPNWVETGLGITTTAAVPEMQIADGVEEWLSVQSPTLQRWYYIVLQSEYEHAKHAREYTTFCQENGLSYETYKSNKSKLGKNPEFNPVAWVTGEKPNDAHEKVIRAIEAKRGSGWTDPPNVHP